MPDFLNILSDTTFSEKMDVQNRLLAAIASNGGGIMPKNFADVQSIVRMGLAPSIFSVGDQFVCMRGDTQLIWDVIGFDIDKPKDPAHPHSMTLQLHTVLSTNVSFSCRYANYCTKQVLTAGTYWFYDADAGKARHFTMTEDAPQNTQIYPIGTVQNGNMAFFKNGSITISYPLGDGEEGTNLDTLADILIINQVPETRNGKGVWTRSNIYRWLNTPQGEKISTYWRMYTDKLEIVLSDTTSGFSEGLDPDFYSVLGCVDRGEEEDEVRFFLLSAEEVFGAAGNAYPYYNLSSLPGPDAGENPLRCKLCADDSYSINWYLRSAPGDNIALVHEVDETGAIGTVNAYASFATNDFGICPACCIV